MRNESSLYTVFAGLSSVKKIVIRWAQISSASGHSSVWSHVRVLSPTPGRGWKCSVCEEREPVGGPRSKVLRTRPPSGSILLTWQEGRVSRRGKTVVGLNPYPATNWQSDQFRPMSLVAPCRCSREPCRPASHGWRCASSRWWGSAAPVLLAGREADHNPG